MTANMPVFLSLGTARQIPSGLLCRHECTVTLANIYLTCCVSQSSAKRRLAPHSTVKQILLPYFRKRSQDICSALTLLLSPTCYFYMQPMLPHACLHKAGDSYPHRRLQCQLWIWMHVPCSYALWCWA